MCRKSNAISAGTPILCFLASWRYIHTVFQHSSLSSSTKALNQTVVKHSSTLEREATYNSVSRLSRLPSYLAIHMVRFTWRRDINKKAKIMVSTLCRMSLPVVFTRVCAEESKVPQRVRYARYRDRRAPEEDATRFKKAHRNRESA